MEDYQPNEVRLDRKGKSSIPAIKVVRRGGHHGSFRGYHPFNQRPRTRPDFRNHSNKIPSGPSFDHGDLARPDQRPLNKTRFGSQQYFPRDSQKHFPRQGPSRANVSPDLPLHLLRRSPSSRETQHEMMQNDRAVLIQQSEAMRSEFSRREAPAARKPFHRNKHANIAREFRKKKGCSYVENSLNDIPIENPAGLQAGRSAARIPRPATFPQKALDSRIPWSQTQSFTLPSNRNAAMPRSARSSTFPSSQTVLDETSVSWSQAQSFTLPSDRNAAIPRSAKSSASSLSQNVLDSYQTGVAWSQAQRQSDRNAALSLPAFPQEDIIDLIVDPLGAPVIEMQPRFFRSGVLNIMPISPMMPFAVDVTPAAESSDLHISYNDVLSRELIDRESNVATTPQEDRRQTLTPSQTSWNGQNEAILPSSASASLFATGSFRMPLDMHDKPRRVLNADYISSLFTVSMRGSIESLDISSLKFKHNLRKPVALAQESVDDSCLLHVGNTSIIILAHAREEKQISYLTFQSGEATNYCAVDRPWNKTKKGGTSVVSTMMQPLMFASGGHDHAVHIWKFSEDLMSVSSTLLAVKHASMIQSLLPIRDTSHKLISAGADCNVHLWDLSSERVVQTFKTSNSPYHAHKAESPFCTLLEVGHRDLQFELRDHRMVPEHPAQRFGFYTSDLHGRFIKGDTWSHFFASGSRNGSVRLWDLRNVQGQPAYLSCFNNEQVVQVLKTESNLLAFSKRGDGVTLNYTGDVVL